MTSPNPILIISFSKPGKDSKKRESLESKVQYAIDCARDGSEYHTKYLKSMSKKMAGKDQLEKLKATIDRFLDGSTDEKGGK